MQRTLHFETPNTLKLILKAALGDANSSDLAALLRAAESHFRILFEQHEDATKFDKPSVSDTAWYCKEALQDVALATRFIIIEYLSRPELQQGAPDRADYLESQLQPASKKAIFQYSALVVENAVWQACISQVLLKRNKDDTTS